MNNDLILVCKGNNFYADLVAWYKTNFKYPLENNEGDNGGHEQRMAVWNHLCDICLKICKDNPEKLKKCFLYEVGTIEFALGKYKSYFSQRETIWVQIIAFYFCIRYTDVETLKQHGYILPVLADGAK